MNPLAQDDELTLEAELRQALQHQRAAIEQAGETRAELERLIARANELLRAQASGTASEPTDAEPDSPEAGSHDR